MSEQNGNRNHNNIEQKPKYIIACDYDGTIYRHDGRGFLKPDLKAVEVFRKHGGLVGLNTGRSFKNIRSGISKEEERTLDAYAFDFICGSSGAELADGDENLFEHHYMEPETALALEKLLPCMISFAAAGGYYYRNLKSKAAFDVDVRRFSQIQDLADQKITTMALIGEPEEYQGKLPEMAEILKTADLPVSFYFNLDSIDIVPKGCSKASALDGLSKHYDVAMDHIYAIGDGMNDRPALDHAHVGFAIADGDPKLHAHADYVVEDLVEALEIIARLEQDQELEEELKQTAGTMPKTQAPQKSAASQAIALKRE